MKEQRPPQTHRYTWQDYTKASAIFFTTTATYLLVRTIGALESLWRWNDDATDGQTGESLQSAVARIEIPSAATARRLLQVGNGVTVVNPIPDQVIEATEVYQYQINKNVFAGNYTFMTVSLANGSVVLPSWLSVEYLSLSSSNYGTEGCATGVQVQGGLAYVVIDYVGLQILNVSNPLNITLLSSYLSLISDVQVQGDLAYVTDWFGLQILNVSDPLNITRLGRYNTSYSAHKVQIQDGLAYVANGVDGNSLLEILNVTNPRNITKFAFTPFFIVCSDVQVQNGLAYVTAGAGLQVLTVTNPPYIMSIGSGYAMPSYAYNVQIENDIAYVADDYSGLQILNISNLLNITLLGSYGTPGRASYVQVQNKLAYVFDFPSGLQIFDVSNPAAITLLGSYDALGYDMQVQNDLVYVAACWSGLQIIDLRQSRLLSGIPTAARVGESYTIRVSAYGESGLAAYDEFQLTVARLPFRVDTSLIDRSVLPDHNLPIDLDSDVLFTDSSGGTLALSTQVFALTSTTQLPRPLLQLNPVFLGSYVLSNNAYDVQVLNGLAYVAGVSLEVLDVSNPAVVTRLGGYNSPGGFACRVQILSGLAYVADRNSGLWVLNVSDPLNITRIGSYATSGGAQDVQVQNGLAYVADYYAGLHILNVSNPTNITRLGSYDTPDLALSVQVQDGLAYVADWSSGLQVLNVSNPRNITRIGGYDSFGYAWDVRIQKGLAYVADDYLGLQILDTSDPTNITSLGGYETLDDAFSVQVQHDVAYVVSGFGLEILNISNPYNITFLGSYATSTRALSVQSHNGVAYIANYDAGLQLLDVTRWKWSVTPSFAEVGNYKVALTATNALGGASSDSFELRVEGGPQLNPNVSIPQLFAKVGVPFNYFIPQGLLSDPNNDPISFTALSANNSTLPSWLSFNGISATFSGLAQSSNVGNYSLRIIAMDNVPGTINAQTIFSLYVDNLPYVNQRVVDQVAGVGLPYSFSVPNGTFIDPDNGDILSYSTRQRDGSNLPLWLNFSASSRRYWGTPSAANIGTYHLVLLANDGHNGEAQSEFGLLVEHFPQVNLNQTLIAPVAGVGQTWSMSLPSNSFTDADDTQLTYQVTRSDGSSLPSWISVNPFSGALLGVPQATDVGTNTLRITASDPRGGSASRNFNVTVTYYPRVVTGVSNQLANVGQPFTFTVPLGSMVDDGGENLTYNATRSNGQPLPSWLRFNNTALRFYGTPNQIDAGDNVLSLIATDPVGASTHSDFHLVVERFPRVNQPLLPSIAGVNIPFSFAVPGNSFVDDDNDPLSYVARQSSGGVLPNWLSFNPQTVTFSGVPQTTDVGTISIRINATDPAGGVASQDFNLTTTHFPRVVTPLSNQLADINQPFVLTVPAGSIVDDDGENLTYTAERSNGQPLPTWLRFNATALRFFGTPNQTDVGDTVLTLVAHDPVNATARSEFHVLVENFPRISQPLMPAVAGVSTPFSLTLSGSNFVDGDNDPLTYVARRSDGVALPNWLTFNPQTLVFSGVPQATDVGTQMLRMNVTDPDGGRAYQDFNLTVVYFPSVVNTIPEPAPFRVLKLLNFSIPRQTFSDLDSPMLIYNATLVSTQPLPSWLSFNAQNLALLGVPSVDDAGKLSVLIRAEDPTGGSVSAPVDLVIQPNFPPQTTTQISTQGASVLQPFDFFAPPNIFEDPNGDSLNYSARLSNGRGLPGWLKFDASNLRFHGTPGRGDTDDFRLRALDINLIAADDLTSASTTFRINVQGDSYLALGVKIGGPIITGLGTAYGLYKARSLLLNRCQKKKYQKLDHTAVMGEEFLYELGVSAEKVAKVQAKLRAPTDRCCSHVVHFFTSDYNRLPGFVELPTWLEYNTEQNVLRSKGAVPNNVKYKELIIQVKDEANITLEQFVLKVVSAPQTILIDDEKEKDDSKVTAKVEVISEEEDAQLLEPGREQNQVPQVTVSDKPATLFASSVGVSETQRAKKPKDEIELVTIVDPAPSLINNMPN